MKLAELFEEQKSGTYVAVLPNAATLALLEQWARENSVALDQNLHVTVLYSRRVLPTPVYVREDHAEPLGFEILGDCLVLKLNAPTLVERHDQLIARGHTHDFEQYIPHLTLISKPTEIKPEELPPIGFRLIFDREYMEPLS